MSKKKLFDIFLTIFTFNLLFAVQLFNGVNAYEQQKNNRLYSEGGSYSTKQENDKSSTAGINEELEMEEQEFEQPNLFTESFPLQEERQRQRQRLANIVDQLRQENVYNQQYNSDSIPLFEENEDKPFLNPDEPRLRNRNAEELEELRRLGMALKQISEEKTGEEIGNSEGSFEEISDKKHHKMSTPVKKGQNEFVEFAEPINQNLNSKRIKDVEWMEKRLPSDSSYSDNDHRRGGGGGPFHFFNASGNILFIAYLTICCVGVVAGTVGGVYYYNHVRSSNVDDPFNEFTRYSPSGPGKDKLKRGAQAFGQTVGDDTLAYKAQLQQYQQQKQKILGVGQTISNEQMSDNEEENDELEHNFSVFECPGLAPTGDVEIQNPNFVGENGENNPETKNMENVQKDFK
ncbi:hypothetical protein ACQ4LE_004198 [Meloidogyne hapla]|uniref:Transmembrane protein n=1 Tax=Meloidogyne hapla TaxID=6305 RepID=A0A1I8AY50_MELHA